MDQYHPNFDWVIFQIDSTFKVNDIMTRIRELMFAADINEARDFSQKYDYDIIPIGIQTDFHKYYEKGTDSIKDITKEDLLSVDTGIAVLLSYLDRKEFYFILEYNSIAGFVNTSDLNKLLSFLPLYVTSLHAETTLRDYFRHMQDSKNQDPHGFLSDQFQQVSRIVDEKGLNNSFDFENLNDNFEKARKNGFYTDIYDELEFWQELALYYHLNGKLSSQSDWNKVREFKEIRNRTMHMKDQLSYSNAKENLSQLLSFLTECTDIIHKVSPNLH